MEQKKIAAGLFAICPETEKFLLLKRRYDVSYPGMWGFPGGTLDESDGYPKITALREFREETGYDGPVKISKEVLYIDKKNTCDFYVYVGILPWEFVPDLKGEFEVGQESLDYGWFGVDDRCDEFIEEINIMLDLKKDLIRKIINKFKNKNYE